MMSIRFIKGLSKLHRQLSTLSIQRNVPPPANVLSSLLSSPNTDILPFQRTSFNVLRSQTTTIDIKSPWHHNSIISPKIENPIITTIIEAPLQPNQQEIIDQNHSTVQDFELPAIENGVGEDGIQAAVLIGIRRKKMKKHKLKKLRKKMKFEWAKVRQRRELRKEKAFQAVLIAQIKEAEKFSAEQYVADKLRQANETPIPKYWKGKRLPEYIIKEKMGL